MDATSRKAKADLKVIILGSMSVGKTAFIQRYIEGQFVESKSTIGAAFSLKQWKNFNIAIWDTAGQEKFTGLSSVYARNAGAAILAYDLTCEESFHALRARFIPLLQAALPDCLVVVVGMKHDLLTNRIVPQEGAFNLARHVNVRTLAMIPYFDTSSKTGHNVQDVFDFIFETCLKSGSKPADGLTIDDTTPQAKSPCGC